MEDYNTWIIHNYSAVEFLWNVVHNQMSKIGYKMNDDIDYNREKFTKFSYMIYSKNKQDY
jgi:hypothetical protein